MGKKEREKAEKRRKEKYTSLNLPIVPSEGEFEDAGIRWIKRNEPKVKNLLNLMKGQLQKEGSPITRLSITSCGIYSLMEEFPEIASGRYSPVFVRDFSIGTKLFASTLMNGERYFMGLSD